MIPTHQLSASRFPRTGWSSKPQKFSHPIWLWFVVRYTWCVHVFTIVFQFLKFFITRQLHDVNFPRHQTQCMHLFSIFAQHSTLLKEWVLHLHIVPTDTSQLPDA